jgi:hypothetical protein
MIDVCLPKTVTCCDLAPPNDVLTALAVVANGEFKRMIPSQRTRWMVSQTRKGKEKPTPSATILIDIGAKKYYRHVKRADKIRVIAYILNVY